MTLEQRQTAEACATLSANGTIHFGEVVARLMQVGIERYHADYTRSEITYYTPQGGSCVVPIEHAAMQIARPFSAAGIATAVQQAQRGEIHYTQFTDQAIAAGCVGYFVQITGRCVQYFGREGQIHTEWFPGAQPN